MSALRTAIGREVAAAKAAGQSYDEILADLSTTLGCLIAAGSQDRSFRLARVKASMSVIAAVLDSPKPRGG